MSRFDVIVPCYRYGHYLRNCVASVLERPGVDVRVLILDDASPDNTAEVACELVRQDCRVEYRHHEVNKKHIDTYNEGLQWASGDYLLLLPADDLLCPGALRRAAHLLDVHQEVGLLHARQAAFTTELPPAETPADVEIAPSSIVPGETFIESCCASADNLVATPTAIVRTALQHEVGGYNKALPHTADLDLWLRLAARPSVAHIDAHQAYKRMHASNMQHQYAQPLVELRLGTRAWQFPHPLVERLRGQNVRDPAGPELDLSQAGANVSRGCDRAL
jgi:glycosyltransferase involved in cell wall biosynthesis